MGAVYKARDCELDRLVALKVIRPDLASDESILSRFKRELILAREITHKNVIRIFDLGSADGVKFITMEFVEGQDLYSLTKDGRPFTLPEKVKIVLQVCRALDAAHSEGVVHRDLKPQNIMVEANGRVVVMDFGIARSMEQAGMTSTGAMIGTPAYMSPEQAMGEKVDTRSDLFALGVIFYELLTGKSPYEAETIVGLALKRIHERPQPPIERDPQVPQALSDVVLKCLAVDLNQRYQTAQEIIRDLESWEGFPSTFTVVGVPPLHPHQPSATAVLETATPAPATRKPWKWVAVAVLFVILAVGGFLFRDVFSPQPTAPTSPVTVVIADIANHTGDPIFDGTLEPILKLAMEGAGFINAYGRNEIRRNLGIPAPDLLDELAALKIAVNQGLGVVVSGSLDREGTGFRLSLKATEAVSGTVIGTAEAEAANKDQVLFAETKVATELRRALGDNTSESAQRFAMETLTATSLEAVHEYAQAMVALSNGEFEAARAAFSKVVDLDPNFGLAYAGMAIASRNLGQQQDSQDYIGKALAHIDRMTERERYRTRGMFYYLTGDYRKCGEEYGALIRRYESDAAARNNLALCSTQLRDMPGAIGEMQRVIEILPKRSLYRTNLALYSLYGGNYVDGERLAREARELSPSGSEGFVSRIPLAFAQVAQGRLPQAIETYQELGSLGAFGASWAASGLADIAIYEGRFSEAVGILEKGAAADLSSGEADRAAAKFAGLAYTQLLRGRTAQAIAAADRALEKSRITKIRFLAARVFAETGEIGRAKTLAAELASETQAEPQAYAKLIEGQMALHQGDSRTAVTLFTEAKGLLDTWIGRFDLGRAYLAAEQFAQADSEFDRCIQRRGEALSLFLDEEPTYGYFPLVYYYQGRVREGLGSSGSADSFRNYLKIRGGANEDPLLAEVRSRIQ
jgi:tetratricopeptide (TPR) repeat protein